jgi:hypothetical protein
VEKGNTSKADKRGPTTSAKADNREPTISETTGDRECIRVTNFSGFLDRGANSERGRGLFDVGSN